jgi:hypothetical protein
MDGKGRWIDNVFVERCYLAPLWIHLDRGLMVPLKSRANGAT